MKQLKPWLHHREPGENGAQKMQDSKIYPISDTRKLWVRFSMGGVGLGMGEQQTRWCKTSKKEQRKIVVTEIHHQEVKSRCAKAASQAKQGQWMNWEGLEKRKVGGICGIWMQAE